MLWLCVASTDRWCSTPLCTRALCSVLTHYPLPALPSAFVPSATHRLRSLPAAWWCWLIPCIGASIDPLLLPCSLNNNKIGAEGAKAIAAVLAGSSLTELK